MCRLPLYNLAKVAAVYFIANGNGAQYMYDNVIRPFLVEHEASIDESSYQARLWLHANVQQHTGWCGPAAGVHPFLTVHLFDVFAQLHGCHYGSSALLHEPSVGAACRSAKGQLQLESSHNASHQPCTAMRFRQTRSRRLCVQGDKHVAGVCWQALCGSASVAATSGAHQPAVTSVRCPLCCVTWTEQPGKCCMLATCSPNRKHSTTGSLRTA